MVTPGLYDTKSYYQLIVPNKIWEYTSSINYLTILNYFTSKLDAVKEPIQVQLAHAWCRVLSSYSAMTRTTVQLQAHDMFNCPIV